MTLNKLPKAKDLNKFKRPEQSLEDALAENVSKRPISKQFTAMKAADTEEEIEAGVMAPTDEQLEKINSFTRTPKSADDVVVFPTLSCNDIVDRDYERFRTDAIEGFAALPQPYSPVGKSFMVGHDYRKLPVGRIFDVDTKTIDGDNYLTNWVYLPNTETNKSYIENVDHGIYWAVSVGVVMGDAECTIGDPHPAGGWFVCSQGHIKGFYYEADGEVDDWGWPIPVDESTKGAELATVDLFDPRDFYELSQVFLGAQYMAQLDEKSGVGGIIKAASAAGLPYVPLGQKEAAELPLQHVPKEVSEAFQHYEVTRSEDGTLSWVDDAGLLRAYNQEESNEVLCLGKRKDENDATSDKEQLAVAPEVRAANADTARRLHSSDGFSRGLQEREPDQTTASGARIHWGPSSSRGKGVEKPEPPSQPESVSEQAILAAARRAGVSSALLEKASSRSEGLLDALVLSFQEELEEKSSKVSELEPLAKVGRTYVDKLQADAVDWYVRARQDPDNPGAVKTATFEKLLKRCDGDIELIEGLLEEQKELAHKRFPTPVRRSTTPADPTEIKERGRFDEEDRDTSAANRLHG